MLKEESHQPDKEKYDADIRAGEKSKTGADNCRDSGPQSLNDENHNSGIAGTTCKEILKTCRTYISGISETEGRALAGLKSQNCENHNLIILILQRLILSILIHQVR